MENKYEYAALCDVCGFKKKASELRKRWDGFMVCQEDWEPRNVLDFYRTRQDAHLLPFTRPDDTGEKTWSATFSGITGARTGTTIYSYNSTTKVVSYSIQIIPTTTITLSASKISIPNYTVATDLKGTMLGSSSGKNYGSAVISGSNIFLPNVANCAETLLIRGSYIAN